MRPGCTFYVEALGCRLNAAEMADLALRLIGAGCRRVDDPAQADLILLNTCAVTAQAARKSRHRLRTLHRRNPRAEIAALGCWVTEAPQLAAAQPGVRWALTNAEKPRAAQRLLGEDVEEVAAWSPQRTGQTRLFLGVQEGCDSHCTYCITRLLRGRGRSRPPAEVVALIRRAVEAGAQEVVLTGVSLGAYGHDLGMRSGLARLVEAILRETALPRLRLSSVEPWDVDEALLALWSEPRLCRQLHLPLQSGCDATLKRMGRRITTAAFARLVERARAISPEIAITTDLIAGFPGETEAEFAQTLAYVEAMAFARLHVFPYSEREGTAAARLPGALPVAVRRERAAQLRALGARMAAAYRRRFVGREVRVLWERRNAAGLWRGLSDNYLEIVAASEAALHNRITAARIVADEGGVMRAIIPQEEVKDGRSR